MKIEKNFSNNKDEAYINFLMARINPSIKPETKKLMIEYALTPKQA